MVTSERASTEQFKELIRLAEECIDHIERIPENITGLDVFVVGGAVRDAVLDKHANDDDFLVLGETVDGMLDRGFEDINASSFGVLHDSTHEEWALARTETKTADGYKGIDVDTEDVTLYEDLQRRDLTMNAMALQIKGNPPSNLRDDALEIPTKYGTCFLIDPFGGFDHAENGTIRHVSTAFDEDPLRVLRAARYAARFEMTPDAPDYMLDELPDTVGFTIDRHTKDKMRSVAPELNRMSRERIGEEIIKAMEQASNPSRFWEVLRDVGALAVLAPQLDRASIVPAGPDEYHREGNTFTHTMMVLDEMHSLCEQQNITGIHRARRFLMALAHDLGKVTIADHMGGLWSDDPPTQFGNHAHEGVSDAKHLATRLGLPDHMSEAMQDASEHHMNIHDIPDWDAIRLIEFLEQHDTPDECDKPYMVTTEELLDLGHADHQGRFQNYDVFESEDEYTEHDDAPSNAGRPQFNRDAFTTRIEAARNAISTITGYEALREGLCPKHTSTNLGDDDLLEQLNNCDSCRNPGPWVDTELNEKRKQHI